MKNKYFSVTCKCGHVGAKHFVRISFPVIATSRKEASAIARYIPRVKHNHKDAILSCEEITYSEFIELQKTSDADPYLKCECKQEQEMIVCFSLRIELEPKHLKENAKTKRETINYRIKKQSYALKDRWFDEFDDEEDCIDGNYAY